MVEFMKAEIEMWNIELKEECKKEETVPLVIGGDTCSVYLQLEYVKVENTELNGNISCLFSNPFFLVLFSDSS